MVRVASIEQRRLAGVPDAHLKTVYRKLQEVLQCIEASA